MLPTFEDLRDTSVCMGEHGRTPDTRPVTRVLTDGAGETDNDAAPDESDEMDASSSSPRATEIVDEAADEEGEEETETDTSRRGQGRGRRRRR